MQATGPSRLWDPFEDTTTAIGGELVDTYDQISRTLVHCDEGEEDQFFQIQPTPIGSYSQVVVVSELSAQDDSNLCNSDVASDFLALSSNSDASSSGQKRSSEDYTNSYYHSDTRVGFSAERVTKKRKTSDSSSPGNHESPTCHLDKWSVRFHDLLGFKQTYGHCMVPNLYPENTHLAQWVKRQRNQHKLKLEGKYSTLSDKRQKILDSVGFIWDVHEYVWIQRWNELKDFFFEHGHSRVPTNYAPNQQLRMWVKCQRRQYVLYRAGVQSSMTVERVRKLEWLQFNWNPSNQK